MIRVPKTPANTKLAEKLLTKTVTDYNDEEHILEFFHLREDYILLPRIFAFTHFPDTKSQLHEKRMPTPGLSITGKLFNSKERPQVFVYNTTLQQLSTSFGATIIMPCGSGKTKTGIAIAIALGLKTAILCHKNFLINQWRENLEEFVSDGVTIGHIQQDTCTSGDFVLCSINSLLTRNYPSEFLEFGLVIVDEAHHIAAPTFHTVLAKIKTKYTIGLTATPRRRDGLEDIIYQFLGMQSVCVIAPKKPEVQVNVIRCSFVQEPKRRYKNKANLSLIITALTKSKARNQGLIDVVTRIKQVRPGSKGLLLSHRVNHLKTLYSLLPHADTAIICGKINTEISKKKRKKTKETKTKTVIKKAAIKFNKFLTLSTFQMFSEAVDFDGDFIILSTPSANPEQPIGRILRGKSGKNPLVVDFVDNIGICLGLAGARKKFFTAKGYTILDLLVEDLSFSSHEKKELKNSQ